MEHAEDMLAGLQVRPLKRDEYETLVELGAFDDERVELLYGRIVEMPPQGPLHDGTIDILGDLLRDALRGRARVRVQSSFLAPDSVPVPDLAVVPDRDYRERHPEEAFLIVEVAQSSLRKDRGPKARLYAECGVPEYWIVDVAGGLVEVHTDPVGDRYTRVQPCRAGDTIRLVAFPDVEIAAGDVLSR